MIVDMYLYDFTKHDYSDIVDLFIYLSVYLFSYFDSCFEKIYFIKNVFGKR